MVCVAAPYFTREVLPINLSARSPLGLHLASLSPSSPVVLQHRGIPGKAWGAAHQSPETRPSFYHQIEKSGHEIERLCQETFRQPLLWQNPKISLLLPALNRQNTNKAWWAAPNRSVPAPQQPASSELQSQSLEWFHTGGSGRNRAVSLTCRQ